MSFKYKTQAFTHIVYEIPPGCRLNDLDLTHDFRPFGELMISPINYIHITEYVSLWTMFTDSGLPALV